MHAARRGMKTILRACAVQPALFLFLVAAPALASAAVSPPNPVAGDTVTTTGGSRECENNYGAQYTFTFTRHTASGDVIAANGSGTSGAGEIDYSAKVTQAGSYRSTMDAKCPLNTGYPVDSYSTTDFTVSDGLGGTLSVSPDPAVVNQPATINVEPSGGNPGYTYAWDLNNDGNFTDVSDPTAFEVNYTFSTTGPHVVSVRITDSGDPNTNHNPSHTVTVTKTITVGTGTTPPPPPPPCEKKVVFKLSEFTTTGCFTQVSSSPQRWTTRSTVKLNGLTFPGFGQTFTITGPTAAEPGGHFTAPNSTMQLDAFKVFAGNFDWTLPDGGKGQEVVIPGKAFTVASGASLLGLHVQGSVALNLGEASDGTYFADLPLSIELPVSFSAGPDPGFGSVTGDATLRVDDAGVHYNGLKLQAKDVWLGKLKVHTVCFSYIPTGGATTTPCAAPSFGGDTGLIAQPGGDAPFIQCNTDANTNRWDASAEIEVPSGLQLGAFGGLANGQLSKLGASINNLGRRVPLAYGLYLDHIAFGLCLSPPPFKIRANVGANFLGASNFVNIDGGFTYTDAYGYNPWSLELDGSVSIGEAPDALPIGSGTLGINGSGVIDFGLNAGVDILNGFASFSAQVNGWIDAPHKQFVVSGEGQGCLDGQCAKAEGELSSTGVAGCVIVGSSLPTYDLIIPLDGSAPYLDTSTHQITAGFGYDWGASTAQLLGGSCDFSAYEPTHPAIDLASAARGGIGLRIARGTQAVALRIHGTHGPPKVVLHGPHGTTITSPSNARAKLRKGHYLIAENRTDGTTAVMLIKPAAGIWTIAAAPGSPSSPTKIDRANLVVPPTFGARVLGTRGARILKVAYAVPVGTSVKLIERAKGVYHTLAKRLGGRRCPGLPSLRPGTNEKILCATVRFTPSTGPGGARYVQAVVTRHGIPLVLKRIASFRVPKLTRPSRVRSLRAKRGKSYLLFTFSPSSGAARYAVSAKLTNGRDLAFDLGGPCRALKIAPVPSTIGAAIKIAGVRYDLVLGRSSALSIKPGAKSAGPKSKKKLRIGKICS